MGPAGLLKRSLWVSVAHTVGKLGGDGSGLRPNFGGQFLQHLLMAWETRRSHVGRGAEVGTGRLCCFSEGGGKRALASTDPLPVLRPGDQRLGENHHLTGRRPDRQRNRQVSATSRMLPAAHTSISAGRRMREGRHGHGPKITDTRQLGPKGAG